MDSKNRFESESLELLNRLKAKKDDLQRRLEEVDREIQAVAITLRLLREPSTMMPINPNVSQISASDLVGKSARQALIEIAKQNGGLVRISQAKPLLINAGIIKSSKNAWGAIYTTLARSREFEKVENEPGTFRLVDEQHRLPSLTAA